MSSSDKKELHIERFHGDPTQWTPRQRRFAVYLCQSGNNIIFDQERPLEGQSKQAKWDENNRDLFQKLLLLVRGPAESIVVEFFTSQHGINAWKALKTKYEQKGTLQKTSLMKRLFADVLRQDEDPDLYFGRLQDLRNQLKDQKVELDDVVLLGLAQSKLPPTYELLQPSLDTTTDLTYDTFKTHVRNFYLRSIKKINGDQDLSSSSAGSSAFHTSNVPCFKCGKTGHLSNACPRSSNIQHSNSRGRGSHRGRGRGRGRGEGHQSKRCNYCKIFGHTEDVCRRKASEQQDKESAHNVNEAFHVEVFPGPVPITHLTSFDVIDQSSKENLLLDSACTSHMVETATILHDVRKASAAVRTARGDFMPVTAIGTLKLLGNTGSGKEVTVTLQDVLVVPDIKRRLLSVAKASENGIDVHFHSTDRKLGHGDLIIKDLFIPLRKVNNLYEATLFTSKHERANTAMSATTSVANLWHQRLGHCNEADVKRLVGNNDGKMDESCPTCQVSKHKHVSFRVNDKRVGTPFYRVYTDVATLPTHTIGGSKYALLFVDEATRWRTVYFLKQKSEVSEKFRRYIQDIGCLVEGAKIKRIRSDNGGEYIAGSFQQLCRENGILQEFTAPYAPQQNGTAERSWRTIMDMVRCMLANARLGKEFWGEAVNSAIYLINRLPSFALNGATPYQVLFGQPASLDHLRIFGCEAYAQIYEVQRHKLDPKASKGILVGYDPHNRRVYRIFFPETGHVRSSIHVTFDETRFPGQFIFQQSAAGQDDNISVEVPAKRLQPSTEPVGAQVDNEQEEEHEQQPQDLDEDALQGHAQDDETEADADNDEVDSDTDESMEVPRWIWTDTVQRETQNLGRTHRVQRSTMCQDATCSTRGPHKAHLTFEYACLMADSIGPDPKTFQEALRSPAAAQWKKAMDDEYNALVKNGTWTLCPLPKGRKAIGTKWVYKTKTDECGRVSRYKARLVAQGFSQIPGRDYVDTFSPVAKISSIRIILALSAVKDYELENMDVDTAFLQANVTEDIYIQQPFGYHKKDTNDAMVCKLNKSLYGLKQSSRNWYKAIDTWFKDYGLLPSAADPCVYTKINGDQALIIVLYVDDLIIAGSNRTQINDFKKSISNKFKMKDLGNLKWILGMEIKRDRVNKTISINQTAYIDQVIRRFGMTDCKPISTPVQGVLRRVPKDINCKADEEYMALVGSLLYAAIITRPDIAYAVQALGRHLQSSGQEHWVAGKRVLRYLKGTRDLGITYGGSKSQDQDLCHVGYSDADWAGDPDTSRSTTAYIFMSAGGAVSWMSRLQPTVALSSTEAEYMALCEAVKESIHMRQLYKSLGYNQNIRSIIYEDNQGCIALSKNHIHHKRTKHINIKYHFVREKVESKEVILEYIPTQYQLADLLTKPLPNNRHSMLRNKVLGY